MNIKKLCFIFLLCFGGTILSSCVLFVSDGTSGLLEGDISGNWSGVHSSNNQLQTITLKITDNETLEFRQRIGNVPNRNVWGNTFKIVDRKRLYSSTSYSSQYLLILKVTDVTDNVSESMIVGTKGEYRPVVFAKDGTTVKFQFVMDAYSSDEPDINNYQLNERAKQTLADTKDLYTIK